MSTYVAAIDLGTTKVVSVIGEKTDNGRYRILAYDEAPSAGVRRGQVENIQLVTEAIRPTLESVQSNTNIPRIDAVFVGIAGQYIRCIENRADTTREQYDIEISHEEIKKLEESMYKIRMEPGEEVLHVIPQNYNVDDASWVTDPVGRLGQRLSGNFHVIIGKSSSAEHTSICIKRLGLSLKRLILEPLASARAVLSEDEKEMGVAMVDMGGGTTDLVVFHNKIVKHTAVIPFGGNIITEDIKRAFNILPRQAEQIKIQYGSCLSSITANNKVITVPGIAGRDPHEIPFKALAQVIEARLGEIMNLVMQEIVRSKVMDNLSMGFVFTGGGSQITHLPQFVKMKTGMDARIGKPEYILPNNLTKDIIQPKFSTAAGLIMCGFDHLEGDESKPFSNPTSLKEAIPEIIETGTSNLPPQTEPEIKKGKSLVQTIFEFFEEKPKEKNKDDENI